MNDRELLELAAKAYFGVEGFEWNPCAGFNGVIQYIPKASRHYVEWNPLTDDGDALRLAVALLMNIEHDDMAWPDETWVSASVLGIHAMEEYRSRASRLEVTRRAIVRAAAEIGRNL